MLLSLTATALLLLSSPSSCAADPKGILKPRARRVTQRQSPGPSLPVHKRALASSYNQYTNGAYSTGSERRSLLHKSKRKSRKSYSRYDKYDKRDKRDKRDRSDYSERRSDYDDHSDYSRRRSDSYRRSGSHRRNSYSDYDNERDYSHSSDSYSSESYGSEEYEDGSASGTGGGADCECECPPCEEAGDCECPPGGEHADRANANVATAEAFLACVGSQSNFSPESCGPYLHPDVTGSWLEYGQPGLTVTGADDLLATLGAILYPADGGTYSVEHSTPESNLDGTVVYSEMLYRLDSGSTWTYAQKLTFSPDDGLIHQHESYLDVAALSIGTGRYFSTAVGFVEEMFDALGSYGEDSSVLPALAQKYFAPDAVTTVQLFFDQLSQKAGADDGPIEFLGVEGCVSALAPLMGLDWLQLTPAVTSIAAGNQVLNTQAAVSTITVSISDSRFFCNKESTPQPDWTATFVIGTNDAGLINSMEWYSDFGGLANWISEICKE